MPRRPPKETLDIYRQQFERLKADILNIGFICTGTLNERWLTCGNPNCRCRKRRSQRHGPYFQLSWKQNGKTVSRFISPQLADLYRDWIRNRRSLDQIIAQMHAISEKAQKCILHPLEPQKLPSRRPTDPS